MRRREFIAGLGSAAIGAAWEEGTFAAERSSTPHVGFISGYDQATAGEFISALRDGLAGYRYVEPHSLKLDLLFANFGGCVSWAAAALVGIIRRESSATCNVRDLMFMNWPAMGRAPQLFAVMMAPSPFHVSVVGSIRRR